MLAQLESFALRTVERHEPPWCWSDLPSVEGTVTAPAPAVSTCTRHGWTHQHRFDRAPQRALYHLRVWQHSGHIVDEELIEPLDVASLRGVDPTCLLLKAP